MRYLESLKQAKEKHEQIKTERNIVLKELEKASEAINDFIQNTHEPKIRIKLVEKFKRSAYTQYLCIKVDEESEDMYEYIREFVIGKLGFPVKAVSWKGEIVEIGGIGDLRDYLNNLLAGKEFIDILENIIEQYKQRNK